MPQQLTSETRREIAWDEVPHHLEGVQVEETCDVSLEFFQDEFSPEDWVLVEPFIQAYPRLVYVAKRRFQRAPGCMSMCPLGDAKLLVLRSFAQEYLLKDPRPTAFRMSHFYQLIKTDYIDAVRRYLALVTTPEERKNPDKDKDAYGVRFHTIGTAGGHSIPSWKDNRFLDEQNEARLRGIDRKRMTQGMDRRELVPHDLWEHIRQVWLHDFVQRLLAEDSKFLSQKQRLEILCLYFGIGAPEGNALTAPQINQRLGITNAKNIIDSAMEHLKRIFGQNPALAKEFAAISATEILASDATYEYAIEVQQAFRNDQLPPSISRLYELQHAIDQEVSCE